MKLLPDPLYRHAIRVIRRRRAHPLDRLEIRFATQRKRLVVYRQKERRARLLRHLPPCSGLQCERIHGL
jgi:hypothetical protein